MSGDSKIDVHLDVSKSGYAGRLEVIEGPTGRRQRTNIEKARIAAESLRKGASIAEIAWRYAITRWQIYDWRRRLRNGRLSAEVTPDFAALVVEEPPQRQKPAAHAFIEIVVGDVIIRAGRGATSEKLSPEQYNLPLEDAEIAQGILDAAHERAEALIKPASKEHGA